MSRIIWTSEMVERLKEHAAAGLTYREIAQKMNLSPKKIETALSRYEIKKKVIRKRFWDENRVRDIFDLKMQGYTGPDIVTILSEKYNQQITLDMVYRATQTNKISEWMLEIEKDIKIFNSPSLPMDDYMVSCDYHSPYFSELWVNRYLAIASEFKIKRQIIVGDLVDLDFAKSHPITDGEKKSDVESEKGASNPLFKALSWFDETWLVCGNHETRLSRITEARIQFGQLLDFFCKDLIQKKFKFSVFDKIQVGKDFLLVHPKSYSQVSGSVAVRLAEKYHKHILNAHGHFNAFRWDRSGKYLAIDIGGMFDPQKIAYVSLITTTHPTWNPGFAMLKDNHVYLFHGGTDFSFWLRNEKC